MRESVINVLFLIVGAMLMITVMKSTASVVHIGPQEYLCYPLRNPFN